MGAGRTELLEALAGRCAPIGGRDPARRRAGRRRQRSPSRIARGLALVPEDRQRDGLVQTMSVGAEPVARQPAARSSERPVRLRGAESERSVER